MSTKPGVSLIATIQQIAKKEDTTLTDLVMGEVVSVDPLMVQIDNKKKLSASFLIVSALCKECKIKIEDKDVVLWSGLQSGDWVRMLKVAGGQKYYLLERAGDLVVT